MACDKKSTGKPAGRQRNRGRLRQVVKQADGLADGFRKTELAAYYELGQFAWLVEAGDGRSRLGGTLREFARKVGIDFTQLRLAKQFAQYWSARRLQELIRDGLTWQHVKSLIPVAWQRPDVMAELQLKATKERLSPHQLRALVAQRLGFRSGTKRKSQAGNGTCPMATATRASGLRNDIEKLLACRDGAAGVPESRRAEKELRDALAEFAKLQDEIERARHAICGRRQEGQDEGERMG